MAFAHVNPLTALWQRRGLSCLLMPEGFDAFAPRRAESTATPPAGNGQGQPRYGHAARQPAAPSRRQAAPPPPAQGQDSGHTTATGPTAGITSGPAAGDKGAQTAASRLWKPLAPDIWPAPWRRQLEKTRPGLVLWTYWNLGLDLCNAQAQGQMERRGFLQKLLQDLAHPAGTHTFWPASLPGEDGAEPAVPPVAPSGTPPAISTAAPSAPEDSLVPHADAFWSGASRLGARGVVVMGSAAVKALGLPSGLRPLQQARYRGHMVWVMWDVDYLQREDQRYASMLAFLRQALRQVTR